MMTYKYHIELETGKLEGTITTDNLSKWLQETIKDKMIKNCIINKII